MDGPKAKLSSDNVFYEQMARRQRIKDVCSEFANEPGTTFLLFFCYLSFGHKPEVEVQKCIRKFIVLFKSTTFLIVREKIRGFLLVHWEKNGKHYDSFSETY